MLQINNITSTNGNEREEELHNLNLIFDTLTLYEKFLTMMVGEEVAKKRIRQKDDLLLLFGSENIV